jgi:hypothetical protein
LERIAASGAGRVEVAGRWFGVRGRRFVRPALTVRHGRKGESRALADLEHKPWAAEDGELWLAAFTLERDLDAASQVELSVAPDITVALRRPGKDPAVPGDVLTAGRTTRAPVAKGDPEPPRRPRPPVGAQELERVNAKLASATQELGLERERRTALDRALEEERSTTRQLRTELGRAQAEIELARAAQAEAAAAAGELEAARRDLRAAQERHETLTREREREAREAQRRHEELVRERDETTQAHQAVRLELHERAGALESAREALAQERAEAGRLRNRLAGAQSSRADETRARSDRPAGTADRAREPRRAVSITSGVGDDAQRSGASEPGAPDAPRRGPRSLPEPQARPPEPLRPLNPSLRHRTYWLARAIALLVLLIVLAAIWIVLHSTVLNH